MAEWGFKLSGTQIEGLGGFQRFQPHVLMSWYPDKLLDSLPMRLQEKIHNNTQR
jgi:hypothetical protein